MTTQPEAKVTGVRPRSLKALEKDREIFKSLVELLPIEDVQKRVSCFLREHSEAALSEVLAGPVEIAERLQEIRGTKEEQFLRDVADLIGDAAKRIRSSDGDPDFVKREAAHARTLVVSRWVDLLSVAHRALPDVPDIRLDRYLLPNDALFDGASLTKWKRAKVECDASLRANAALSEDDVVALMEGFSALLLLSLSEKPFVLPHELGLVRRKDGVFLRGG